MPQEISRESYCPEIPRSARTSLVGVDRGLRIDGRECSHNFPAQSNTDVFKINVVTFPAPFAERKLISVAFLVFGY
jgi:hypothetical protein